MIHLSACIAFLYLPPAYAQVSLKRIVSFPVKNRRYYTEV